MGEKKTLEAGQKIYFGGRIYTLDEAGPLASVMAVRGAELVYVGSSLAAAEARVSKAARREDLRGGIVTPGLLDSHAHLVGEGLRLAMPALAGLSRKKILALVAEETARRPPGEWIIGHGWNQNDWPAGAWPTLEELDAAAPNNPTLLDRVDKHAVWLNSLALAAVGMGPETAAPPGGELLKDGRGVLTGSAAILARDRSPRPDAAAIKRALLAAQAEFLASGVTGGLEISARLNELEVLGEAYREGLLKLRLRAMLFAESGDDAAYIEGGGRPATGLFGERFSINGIKILADGSLGARSAWLSSDYADRPGHRGSGRFSDAELAVTLRRARDHGFQAAIHAIGDAAAEQAVRVMAEILGPEPGDHRWRLEHFQVVSEAVRDKVLALGLIPSIQAAGLMTDLDMAEERLGPALSRRAYAWREILDGGGIMAGGSDAPVESVNPFLGIYAAVSRKNRAGRPAGGWRPEHRFTRLEALKSYTVWAAWAMFAEKRQGSLVAGKLADFAVLDRDPLTCPEEELRDLKVLKTVIGGETVYESRCSPSNIPPHI